MLAVVIAVLLWRPGIPECPGPGRIALAAAGKGSSSYRLRASPRCSVGSVLDERVRSLGGSVVVGDERSFSARATVTVFVNLHRGDPVELLQ